MAEQQTEESLNQTSVTLRIQQRSVKEIEMLIRRLLQCVASAPGQLMVISTCSTRQPATEPGLASSVRKTPLTTRQEYRLEQIRGLAWGQLPEAQGNRVAISMYGCSKARAVRMLVTASELRLDSNSLEHSFKADSAPIRAV